MIKTPVMHETFSPANGRAHDAFPELRVDEGLGMRLWLRAAQNHPELQAKGRRNMRLVALQLAMSVCYDPRLSCYGQCWPTVDMLAEWCGLSRRGVQGILRRLEALGILTVEDRRPKSNLYTLRLDVNPWKYCY